jgi:ATP-dependent Clp protease adaptor protein ClpS
MGIELEKDTETKNRLAPMYNLVLLNDEYHTYQYVVGMLIEIFKFELEKAISHTIEVDSSGRSIVYTGPLEHSEMKQEQVHNYGADSSVSNCQGSMTAELEPVE